MISIKIFYFLLLALFTIKPLMAQNTFEIDANTSMLLTGKGQGQDGAINPYLGEKCKAIVKNLSNYSFEVRIQQKGKLLNIIKIEPLETKTIILLENEELYVDTTTHNEVKFKLDFEKHSK